MVLITELPAELLVQILASSNSLSDLWALVNTSRRICSVFHNSRARIIYRVFATELGPHVLADAIGLSQVQALDGTDEDYQEYRRQFSEAVLTYAGFLKGHRNASLDLLTLDRVLALIRTYRRIAFMTNMYLVCTLKLLEREVRSSCPGPILETASLVAPPSRSEWLRVLRAHYRLRIVLLFWESLAHGTWEIDVNVQRLDVNLFALWEPWEVQQVFCAGAFYKRISSVLASKIRQGDGWRAVVASRRRISFDQFREVVEQVRAADEDDWEHTLDNVSSFPYYGGSVAAGRDENAQQRWFHQTLRQAVLGAGLPERRRSPVALRFEGEGVSTVPFAWLDAFDGRYKWDFGGALGELRLGVQPVQGLWARTGFLMWDRPRVEVLKTSALLSRAAMS